MPQPKRVPVRERFAEAATMQGALDLTATQQSQNTKRASARFSAELESTLHRARTYANQRKHEHTTLKHLLLALMDDMNASGVMRVCDVDVAR